MGNANCCLTQSTVSARTSPEDYAESIKRKFTEAGQGHVFNAWDSLDRDERMRLIEECTQFNVDLINDLY